MKEEKSTLTVTLKRDGVKRDEYKKLVFPMSNQEFDYKMQELSSIKSARYVLNNLETNLPLEFMYQSNENYYYIVSSVFHKSSYYIYNFNKNQDKWPFENLNSLTQMLNDFSSLQEIQALVEMITDELEEIEKIIIDGNYHFYPNMSLLDMQVKHHVLGEPIPYWDIEEDNPYMQEKNESALEEYADKGYFQTSTGVLLIQDKYLYYKARTKWENQKKEQDQEQ